MACKRVEALVAQLGHWSLMLAAIRKPFPKEWAYDAGALRHLAMRKLHLRAVLV